MKKMLRFILLLVVLLGIAAAAGMWKVRQLADSKLLIKEETIFTLEAGTGRLALGQDLYREKVINRPRVFQWLLRVEPELSHFKAGTYRFTPQMTVREMLQLLASGKEAHQRTASSTQQHQRRALQTSLAVRLFSGMVRPVMAISGRARWPGNKKSPFHHWKRPVFPCSPRQDPCRYRSRPETTVHGRYSGSAPGFRPSRCQWHMKEAGLRALRRRVRSRISRDSR